MWQVGAAKRELRMDFTGLELLGWGQPEGRIERVGTPLWVRGVALQWQDTRWVYVCAELCFITQSVRDGVRRELEARGLALEERELVIAATHTHSGPAGFAHALFYNLSNPGHHPEVYTEVVGTIADVVESALGGLQPGAVRWARGQVPLDQPVAFNRNLRAFAANRDCPAFDPERPETATNRDLTVLRIDAASGPLAAVCWFAVHNTSVHFDQRTLHGDNKGVAAAMLEQAQAEAGRTDFVGIFAQGAPGDVTPNYRPSQRGFHVGPADDDFESAQINGGIQGAVAAELFAGATHELHGLHTAHQYVDFDGLEVDADFAGGRTGRVTGKARYGLAMIEGTAEGPGPLFRAQIVRRALVRAVGTTKRLRRKVPGLRRRYRNKPDIYGPMFPFLDAGWGAKGKAFGLVPMLARGVPGFIDPVVAEVQRLHHEGVDLESPWTPSIVPVHLTHIGDFALLSLPCEPTTTSGWRLAATVQQALGCASVQVAGYSNAYSGYLTTFEEYQLQGYEAGHTVFGQYALAGYRSVARRMARAMARQEALEAGPEPLRFAPDEVQRRRYQGPPPKRSWG